MTKTIQRIIFLSWILFGIIPMTLIWSLMWPILQHLGMDIIVSEFMSAAACYAGFLKVLFIIDGLEITRDQG